jgi:hypothetical protein
MQRKILILVATSVSLLALASVLFNGPRARAESGPAPAVGVVPTPSSEHYPPGRTLVKNLFSRAGC